MKIKLYTIHCPQCNVLRKKLDAAGISYSMIDDKEWLIANGYTKFPVLEIDDMKMNFSEAINWLKER